MSRQLEGNATTNQCLPIIPQQLPDVSTRVEGSQEKKEENGGVEIEEEGEGSQEGAEVLPRI